MNLKKIALTTATSLLVLVGAVTFLPLRAIAGLESPCNYISDLVATNPLSSDLASTGDDHMRCIKLALKTSFPGVSGAVTSTHTELNLLDGITGTVWSSANDGAGSGLDADLLDGSSSAAFAQLSAANTFTASNPTAIFSSAVPSVRLIETGAAANNGAWEINADGEQLNFYTANDALNSFVSWLTIDRTGTTVDSINMKATAVVNTSAAPAQRYIETGAAANNGTWEVNTDGEQFNIYTANDALSSYVAWLTVNRTGTTVDSVNLQATAVQVNGSTVRSAALDRIARGRVDNGVLQAGSNGITSTARTALGTYTVNITAAGYATTPICVVSGIDGITVANGTASSTTNVNVTTVDTAAANFDTNFNIICMGT